MDRKVRITDAEFAILEALWDAGEQPIRDLTARLYPSASVSDYATVQKLLERLEAKGCVARDRSRHAHVFRAAKQRDDLIGSRLRQLAEQLCDGSLTPVLLHLVQRAKLSKSERNALRKMLDDHDGPAAAKGKKSS
jgi:BlaI family transcriptional regulator, penicillinase repressor